jgi:hypothetical protein
MKYTPRRISTATLLCNLALSLLILAVIFALTSCGVRLEADGAKEFSVDASAFAVALQVLAEK